MDRHTLRKALPYLLPSAAGTAVFYAAPFLVMLVYALSAGSVPEVLSGHALAAGVRSTAVFLSCGIGASVLLGLCIALALPPRTAAMKLTLLLPLLLPSAAVAVLWRALHLQESLFLLILLLAWRVTGLNAVLLTAAHQRIPPEVVASGRLDGAGGLRLLLRVKWPYLSGSVFFAALIDLFFAWRTFREVYLLTGDYPHEGLYLLQHYLLHAFRRLQYGKLAAVSLAVTLALAAVTGLFFRLSSDRGKDVDA